ncbi:hypothetical protein N0V93_005748 [Gnomoniopsis smithogilvyi]|uniref:Uncharacterized protein n=1 Tax=Gnomoniopsis smithogilvyi TaxID=1191159 RepID=A0A9W8YTE0_9PEZI|nr:hypothetical protein N0V93_005748 [Gnomoniopsis smithogilvyi]
MAEKSDHSDLIVVIIQPSISIFTGLTSQSLNTPTLCHPSGARAVIRSAPSAGQKRFPGFNFVSPTEPAQEPVLSNGYPWVQTNTLIPTWSGISFPPPLPEAIASLPIGRLNRHGHHGLNTHLVLRGDLTLERIRYSRRVPLEKIRISADGPVNEAPVGAGDIYLGTTEGGCDFVEGHRCLSPTTALRFVDRGTLCWYNKDGEPAPVDEQRFISDQLRGHSRFGKVNGALVFEVPNTHLLRVARRKRLACELREWFQAEWTEDDLERMPSLPASAGDG